MNHSKGLNELEQKQVLGAMLSDPTLFSMVCSIIKPEYFNPELKEVVSFILNFYAEHNNLPPHSVVKASKFVDLPNEKIEPHLRNYFSSLLEEHCRYSAFQLLLGKAIDIHTAHGNTDSLWTDFQAISGMSITKDLGINPFDDVQRRLDDMKKRYVYCPSGWQTLDAVLGGGWERGTLNLIAAPTGVGKSIFLGNVAMNFLKAGMDVVVLSLELNEDSWARRTISSFVGINKRGLFDDTAKIAQLMDSVRPAKGNLLIEKLPGGSNAQHIRNYMGEYKLRYGKYPDAVCVDYLDLMRPINLRIFVGAFERDKAITEELRDVFVDFEQFGFSASQLNREAVGQARPTIAHIAGGLSKINTCDTAFAMTIPEEESENSTTRMITELKIRDEERHPYPFNLYLDPKSLLLTDNHQTVHTTPRTNFNQNEKKINMIKDEATAEMYKYFENLRK